MSVYTTGFFTMRLNKREIAMLDTVCLHSGDTSRAKLFKRLLEREYNRYTGCEEHHYECRKED